MLIAERDHLADTVNPRDPNRPEPSLCFIELFCDASVPSRRHPHILMYAYDQFSLRPCDANVEPIRGARAVPDCDDLVRRFGAKQVEARRFVRSVASFEAQVTNDSGDVPAAICRDLPYPTVEPISFGE